MTNRKFISVFILLWAGLNSITSHLVAMIEGDPELPQISMKIDAPLELNPLFPFPRIGHYATPYDFATPLVAVSSSFLINIMPENLIRAVGGIYSLSGSVDAIRASLLNKLTEHALQVSLVIWSGLSSNPAHYNAVFHQIVGGWLGLQEGVDFNTNISAGLFTPQKVKTGAESIAFDSLGILNVNRHDHIKHYSPNNGRFYPEAGKDMVSFWIVGTYGGHTVVSYNLMLLSADVKKRFLETVDTAKGIGERAAQLDFLITGLRSIEKVIQDRSALSGVIQALENMQLLLIAQNPIAVPAKKPAEIKRDAAGDLALLNSNLRALEAAVKKEKPKSLIEVQQQAATEALLAEIEARELQSQEDALFAISLDKS